MARFDCAIWRPISANTGGAMSTHRGVLMHQQVGYGSLFGYFGNPKNEVSAHWWVSRAGIVEQYIDSERVAWHARHLNGEWCGIEFEGMPTDPITAEQIDAGARILGEGARRHGWPLVLANSATERGFGFHRMPGGVATACPSDLRLASRPDMLALAGAVIPPAGPIAPPVDAAAPVWPGRLLRETHPLMSGSDVEHWQRQMDARGWSISVDSFYGRQSSSVCRAFQSEKGLAVDGIVGPDTWAATWTAPIT